MAEHNRESKETYPRPVTASPTSDVVDVQIRPGHWQTAASIGSLLAGIFTLAMVIVLSFQLHFAKQEFIDFKAQSRADRMEERYQQFSAPEMIHARGRAAQDHPKFGLYAFLVFEFFERLARDHAEGIVSTEDVVYTFEQTAPLYWCGWREEVKKIRIERGGDPETGEPWQGFQSLAEEMLEYQHRPCLDRAQISDLLRLEKGRIEAVQEYLALVRSSSPDTLSASFSLARSNTGSSLGGARP